MDPATARAHLESERARLDDVRRAAGSLTGHGDDDGPAAEQHGVEQATSTIERELDTTVIQKAESELLEVEAALERIEAGGYGICEVCHQPIPEERLEALPATRYCVADQARVEREPWLRQNGN
jgi:RNA polymerase-binding transcription factor DksA